MLISTPWGRNNMADFSLRDLWWLQPKGPDNPLPALQLGANIAQNKAAMDLKERDLANDIARTSLMRDEMLYKQKLQTSMVAGNAAIAGAIAGVDDWTDPEQVQRVYEVGAQYPMVVGSKAWQGAEYMHKNAITAQRLQQQAEDRSEIGRAKLELQQLLADSTIDLNDARIRELQSDIAFAERRMGVQEGNLALRTQELQQKGQRLSLRGQRMYDNELKSLNREEATALKTATDPAETKRLSTLYNLRRRELTNKYYGNEDTAPPKPARPNAVVPPPPPMITPPATVSPTNRVSVVSPDGKVGTIPASQLEDALKAGYKQQ